MYSLSDTNQIHNFAIKWSNKFQNKNTFYVELADHFIADECAALGFEMDCGNAFEQKYGRAVYDYNELNRIIDNITDISLLGSAIYSRWRYFNHWANSGTEILEDNNRMWFVLAFDRLALLTK